MAVTKDKNRVAIIDGSRIPFAKAWGVYKGLNAAQLGQHAVNSLLEKVPQVTEHIDAVYFGMVAAPPSGPNVARELLFRTRLSRSIPAFTVQMYCASGLRAIADGANMILSGKAEAIIAGGTDTVSASQALFSKEFTDTLRLFAKAKSLPERFKLFTSLQLKDLKPEVPGLNEPTTGLTMGQAAEKLAKELGISRKEQDEFALKSHQNAAKAIESGIFKNEVAPCYPSPKFEVVDKDTDVRADASLEKMSSLKPAFDRDFGTITAANASFLTDGASATLIMSEAKAKELGLTPLAYIKADAAQGVDLQKENLFMGPAYCIPKVLKIAQMELKDIDAIEMHEAFAAQVLGNVKCLESKEFAVKNLGRSQAVGEVDRNKLNVYGGSISLGHPFGATGSRLVNTLSKRMARENLGNGLISICAAGGLAMAMILER